MLEALTIVKTIGDLFGQLKELASGGNQRRRDDEYRREFERIWSQIALMQNQFFTIILNQSIVTATLQAGVDELKSTVGSLQTQMTLQIQSGLMQQPTEQVRQQIFDFADHAAKQIKALPLPTTDPLDGLDRDRPSIVFEPPQPQPLPPAQQMTAERRLVTLVRREMTSAPYYRPCQRYDLHEPWCLMAFVNSNDYRIHVLAIQGIDPAIVRIRYYRHAYLPLPADNDSAWDNLFQMYHRILDTEFVALPDVGITHLASRMEREELDRQLA